MNLSPVVWGSS